MDVAKIVDIATARVDAEDTEARHARIRNYAFEIQDALAKLETYGSITFGSSETPKAKRVVSALRTLGYTCSDPERRAGEWQHGAGTHYYLLVVVTSRPASGA